MYKLKRIGAEGRPCGTSMPRGNEEDEIPVWLVTSKVRRNRRLKTLGVPFREKSIIFEALDTMTLSTLSYAPF
jgi:hypothetical protein